MNNGKGKEKHQPVQVFIRVRPMNKQEQYGHNHNIIDVKSNRELTVRPNVCEKYHRNFSYERVFGPTSRQMDIYTYVAEPMVAEVLAGYNCTVFAYGQTGTGKTYTMTGNKVDDSFGQDIWHEDAHSGIIPRTLAHLFDELRVREMDSRVIVSYMELYNEELFDLLSPPEDTSKLKLYEDNVKKGSVVVQGLTEITVSTKNEVFKVLERGAEKRKTASTLMNAQSSRSHCVFCITVNTKEGTDSGEDLLKTGKLYLVDLAGSENIKQSGATDKRAREACNINQSLLTLGRVITSLAERRPHVPYRESKLTRLLQDSLGGRTKTSLIATVSPASGNMEETINTLEYASRARCITNKPEANQCLTRKGIIKEYADQIDRLKKDLQAMRFGTGVCLAQENYDDMVRQLEFQKDEITEKIAEIRMLNEQMTRVEEVCVELKIGLQTAQSEVRAKEEKISELESTIGEAKREISDLKENKEKQEFVIIKQTQTAKQLKNAAQKLLKVTTSSTADNEKLHDKIEALSIINNRNKETHSKHLVKYADQLRVAHDRIEASRRRRFDFHNRAEESTRKLLASHEEFAVKREALRADFDELKRILTVLIITGGEHRSSTNEVIDTVKLSADEELKTACARLEEHFGTRCQPLYDGIIAALDSLLEGVVKNAAECEREVSLRHELVAASIKLQRNALQNLERERDELAAKVEQLGRVYMSKLKRALFREDMRKQFDEQMAIAFSALRRASDISAESYDDDKIEAQRTLEGMRLVGDDVQQVRSMVRRIHSDMSDNLEDLEQELRRAKGATRDAADSRDAEIRGTIAEVYDRVSGIYDASRSTGDEAGRLLVGQHDTFVARFDNELSSTIEEHAQRSSALLDDAGRQLETIGDAERVEAYKLADAVTMHTATMGNLIEEDRTATSEEHDAHRNGWCELQETVAQIDYCEYQKTYQTPGRNAYNYPRELPEVRDPKDFMNSPLRITKVVDFTFDTPDRSPLRCQNLE